MSGGSSSAAGWCSRLEPVAPPATFQRADDPRLEMVVEFWRGDPIAIRPGRAVIVGFPQDEGVRRNQGRPGAAQAPAEIRRWLYRLTPWDAQSNVDLSVVPPLDAGDVRIAGALEDSQAGLAEVIAGILTAGAVPIVLGGGHETGYGHFLGYVAAGKTVGIVNLDAHLDVRPCLGDLGHSGSPFREALEHPSRRLAGAHYACIGAQPPNVSREHARYVQDRGGRVWWCERIRSSPSTALRSEIRRLSQNGCPVYVTLDADVAHVADVPGVSAPNAAGLAGIDLLACARLAGQSAAVASFDLVEINPPLDRDGQSARWAALAIWHFLVGLAERARQRN